MSINVKLAKNQITQDSYTFNPYGCPEISRMETALGALLDAEPPMQQDLTRVIKAGGKRLRPVLAMLCYRLAKSGHTDVKADIVPLMCMLELMHTASLVHDDVVDNATVRRGHPTINKTSGSLAAVQSGDYLLAKAMEILGIYKGTGINEELTDVSEQMCLGELEQLKIRYKTDEQNEALYFLQIYRKTASLIAASCYTGALAAGLEASQARALKSYGERLGTAFQLRDDLMDYDDAGVTGKAPGQDLKNGIYTLPILRLLKGGVPYEIGSLLKTKNKKERQIQELIHYIKSTDALGETEILIKQLVNEAVDTLESFPACPEKTALTMLARVLTKQPVLNAYSGLSQQLRH